MQDNNQGNYYYGGYNGGYQPHNTTQGPEIVSVNENQVHINGELYEKPMTIGGWIGTSLLMAIPVVNIIAYLVFLFSGKKKSRQRMFLASLVMTLIIAALGVAAFFIFGATLNGVLQQLIDYLSQLASTI